MPGTEALELIFYQYLMLRREITGEIPKLRICDAASPERFSEAFVRRLVDGPRRVAVEVEFHVECPAGTDLDTWFDAVSKEPNSLLVLSVDIGALTSSIETLARPDQDVPARTPRMRRERFTWDHARGVGGFSLLLSEFQPSH